MAQLLGIVDYIVIAITLALSTLIGLYFRFSGGRQKTTNEFLMGNQNVHILPVAVSIIATSLSSVSVLGVPAEMYLHGTQYVITGLGIPLGGLLAAYGFLPVFYEMQVSTAYQYLEKRFGKTIRTFVATLYTFLTVLDMGVVLYAPALALNAVTGLSTWASILSIAAVCMVYSSQGGLKAVVWTVVFQSALMYLAMVALIVKISMMLGFNEVFDIARRGGRFIFFEFSGDLTERYTFWNSFAYGFTFWLLLYGSNQSTIQRFLSVGSLRKAQQALILSIPFLMFFTVFTLWDGIALYALFYDCDPIEDENVKLRSADQLMPYGILYIFGNIPGLTGLCIAGVFSASLGALSSAVNALANITVEDFIKPFCCRNISDTWMTFIAKLLAVGYIGLILLMALVASSFRSILEAATIIYCMITAPILGIYLLGMFSTTANEKGTLVGLLTGVTLYAWAGFGNYITKPGITTLPRNTTGCYTNSSTEFVNISTDATIIESSTDVLHLTKNEESDIFIVYKLSYMWLPLFSVVITLVVGYLTSFLLKFCIHVPEVKPETISPFVRKLYFKTSADTEKSKLKIKKTETQKEKTVTAW
ncbi:putative sodium-dependent multivitamin transporter [Argiope bruennichi]|uniref:putative sodium-dependent multivitamin transporter n=1 Tax=Argiope bruennichi TaxID=94029 RepID=UPI002493EA42|nr:putative sodium-dependent multivitamin transporter [Argiope bruennichi]XP_055946613.1 putative sodium-dependent multivitamin transporter [Argiope bruennichi]XP_055946614.1 putative sodium-dependent multivitamin transporter [Argiope bruennichi]